MSETRFTPGPWVVHPIMAWVSPAADLDMPICQLRMATDGESCEAQAIPDANLIASAPELFEALERAVDALASLRGEDEPPLTQVVRGRAALRKARGESEGFSVEGRL